jgi:diguanylate cyclase (GGDEF)-like protein
MINRRKSGEDYHVQVVIAPVNNDVGEPMAYLSIQRDISAQKDDQHRMQQLLYVDGLTGLGNRSKLIDTLDKQLQHHKDGLVGYLLLLNIDRFKWVNATHGVAFGDQLLVALAERLNTFIADSGIVVRLEGDKFALLLTTSEQWRKDENWLFGWQNALQSLVTASFKLGSERINIHCSMGITQIDANHQRSSIDIINTVIAQASTALKLAQKLGGNRLEPFKSEMSDRDLEAHNIELELTSALKHNELRLFVQEQVDEQDKLVGAECLIRWQHPVKGLLAPFAFISVAEQSDLIIKIGYWVIQDACRILAQAQQQGLMISLSVNISPRHFLQPDFIDNTLAIVQAKGIKPSSLILEITESLFMENLDEVTQKMKQLKAMGFRFSIDDFGTGYSSLSYLKHLPIDELKIDRAFVTAMGEEGLSQSLVETIYAVATKMHLHIVAEGVETQAQSDMLKALPGIIQQGYYHSRPEDADDWLAQKTNKS